jgi:lysophospholipase L1-like esterase
MNTRAPLRAIALLAQLLLLAACGDGPVNAPQEIDRTMLAPATRNEVTAAATKRVIFAHQSVGGDILAGVNAVSAGAGVPLNVVETRIAPATGGGIYHFKVGTNGDPLGKIREYHDALAQTPLTGVDVALVKLCYIDFNRGTDAAQIATAYVQAIEDLQSRHPQTRFVAVTTPLTTIQTGPKAWVKSLLGKTPAGYAENAKREEFNAVLRQKFGAGRLFDVAKLESQGGAEPVVYDYQGSSYEALDPALTSDGGHLNDAGKRVVGSAFVKFLANLPAS